MDRQDLRTFLRRLVDQLVRDFDAGYFKHYFVALRGLRGIETRRRVIVKSATEVVFEREICQRHGIGILAEQHGGGYLRILILDDAPQPWEPGGIAAPSPPAEQGSPHGE